MTTALIISLRESFETALVLCVMLALLKRTQNERYNRWVFAGLGAGALLSMALSAILTVSMRSLPEHLRMTSEGIIMVLAAVLVGWMTIWMASKSSSLKQDVEREVSAHVSAGSAMGIFLMSLLSTVREGTEMVIMVHAAILSGVKALHAISGVIAGITGATLLGWMFFQSMRLISLRHFFAATGVILLLIGTSLTIRGSGMIFGEEHEHAEASEHAEETLMQEVMEVLVGVDEVPTPVQGTAGLLYLGVIGTLWHRAVRRKA